MAATQAITKLSLVSDEINTILAEVLGRFLVQGNPTKHGGLRFLDIQSAKTFGFDSSEPLEGKGNLLKISAPVDVRFEERTIENVRLSFKDKRKKIEDLKDEARERIEKAIKGGPRSESLHEVAVRPSDQPGKEKKLFVEVQYIIPTLDLLQESKVLEYARQHGVSDTNLVVKLLLRAFVVPMAVEVMSHLIDVIRAEH